MDTNKESRYVIVSNNDDGMHPDGYHRICDLKTNSILGIIDDYAIAKGLAKKLEQADRLDAENERLANALEYIYESGSLLNQDVVDKARWGLGMEVENEQEIAALKPRFS
ncbi:hypothetical protein [Vibrio coralliilyticus]|uniref:Uncharacterized protein n=1 Tax=Vibrio coralliilyticus TaxID=190893 RepID=A0AAP6ZTY5_9VIBR|nr:hypothetical protein [Vibrio coralliilyticus]NOI31874.1 hypothetical protein [Vibrio coralliilyticus]NOJ25318.1 hypothetical protein [Vibrio coralliilyticus]